MQVLFALIMGAGALGQMAPAFTAITEAQAAAARIYSVLDRVPVIDTKPLRHAQNIMPAMPLLAKAARGRIEFRNVTFSYPTRPGVVVLRNFNLTIESGERLALVGPSGGGKSTLVALVQRWYDVDEGAVLIDGVDVREWSVQELRAHQALVSQESLLLTGSVAYNIALGVAGHMESTPEAEAGDDADFDASAAADVAAIQAAAAGANASDFIAAMPQGLATPLTNSSLSGGQRQRLCIARALLRTRATILLLDEATSALDSASEALVQSALEALHASCAGSGTRTTLTIAHRLSTIDAADRVIVLVDGAIVEEGAPATLMAMDGGVFRKMRTAQVVGAGVQGLDSSTHLSTSASSSALAAVAATVDAVEVVVNNDEATATTPTPATRDAAAKEEEPSASIIALTENEGEAPPVPISWLRLASYNRAETGAAIVGFCACVITGLTMPAFALILSNFIAIYYDPVDSSLWSKALFYMGMFFLIGGSNFIACIVQQYCFGLMGERLVRRVRSAAFGAIVRFEVGWHDKHAAGAVTAALGADAYLLRSASGPTLALTVQNIFGLIGGFGIAFAASWRITLIVFAIAPFLAFGMALQLRTITTSSDATKLSFSEVGEVLGEALGAPRTVAAYALQRSAFAATSRALVKPTKVLASAAWASGIGFSIMAGLMIG